MLHLQVDRKPHHAIIYLCRKPHNAFDGSSWQQLSDTFRSLEEDIAVRGVIFASGNEKDTFCSGV